MAKRKARIKAEVVVGVTAEMGEALENAVNYIGTTQSQYSRQALLEKLIREGFLAPPMPKSNNSAVAAGKVASHAG